MPRSLLSRLSCLLVAYSSRLRALARVPQLNTLPDASGGASSTAFAAKLRKPKTVKRASHHQRGLLRQVSRTGLVVAALSPKAQLVASAPAAAPAADAPPTCGGDAAADPSAADGTDGAGLHADGLMMGDAEFAALGRSLQNGKVIFGHQMRRLRYCAAMTPALELAKAIGRLALFPPRVPPAAWPVVRAAANVDASFDGLNGNVDDEAAGMAAPSRMLVLCQLLVSHAGSHLPISPTSPHISPPRGLR